MEDKVEIWKSHPNIAGLEVSTLGNVKTLDKVVSSEKGTKFIKGHILKQYSRSGGYLRVCFRANNKSFYKSVHRLVAQTFIHNPDNLPDVNHKDCDRTNNDIDNLEWCTPKYNRQYREKFGKASSKPVFAINLKTLKISRFPSQIKATKVLGLSQGVINRVIKGKRKQTGGFWFVNAGDNAVDLTKQKLREIGKTNLIAADTASAEFVSLVNAE